MPIDPIAQKMLDDAKASGRPNAHLLPVPVARENFENTFGALAKPDIHGILDVDIPTRDGVGVPGRLYLPSENSAELPLVVYYHGGGWLLGSIDSHDVATRLLANASGAAVLSVGYRRGPESRFPTAVHDAIDALNWAVSAESGLPVDTGRVAVAGDSAGGNLAAAVALHVRDSIRRGDGGPALRHQLLVYPVTTTDLARGMDPEYDGVMLERDELQWHQDNYLADPSAATDPLVNVLDAELAGLPEATVILAECDPIRPQGELYAKALAAAGVLLQTHETPGMVHGFFGLDEVFPTAGGAMTFAGQRLADALAAGADR
jgi:acetyl esterase/lipase